MGSAFAQALPQATGEMSAAGRPLFADPSGGVYSEKTITFQTPDGAWVNAPSVLEGGHIETDQGVLEDLYYNNHYTDPVTGRKLPVYKTLREAEEAARQRSGRLLPRRN